MCMTQYSDDLLQTVLTRSKRIAVVGFSMNPQRPSYDVARFLASRGYEILPINPGHAGKEVFGTRVLASLSEITGQVDMVDIFRRSDAVGPVVDEALTACMGLGTIWMQLGVINEDAAQRAEAAGVTVIQDRCPKIEIHRLGLGQ